MKKLSEIDRYGRGIIVYSDTCPLGRATKGFIQPITFSDTERLEIRSAAGKVSRAKFLLIAEKAAFLPEEKNIRVSCQGAEYDSLRVEPVYIGGALTHWEGVLRLKSGGKGNA